MSRPSKREIETAVGEITPAGRPEFVRQAAAVVAGDREAITAETPETVDLELVSTVANAGGGDFAEAWTVVAETAVTPPPLADFGT